MDTRTIRRQKRLSGKQEKRVAGLIGGRVVPASGAVKFGGGHDANSPDLVVECKYTEKKSYSLKRADLKKLRSKAIMDNCKSPMMHLNFLENGKVVEEFAIIPFQDYLALRESSGTSEEGD